MRSQAFLGFQIALGAIFLLLAWALLRPRQKSGFRARESDRRGGGDGSESASLGGAGSARASPERGRRDAPLLDGFDPGAAPHRILGVREGASEAEIRAAYKLLMKRYHPDRVAPSGSNAWRMAQRYAEAINRARDELLRKTSGR